MTISFSCSSCGAPFRVGDEWGGKSVKCKKCGTPLLVPTIDQISHSAPPPVMNDPGKIARRVSPPPIPSAKAGPVVPIPAQQVAIERKQDNDQLKECPFCSESVLLTAKKCKHCGETIDVALRVAEEARRASERQSNVFMNAGGGGAAASSSSTGDSRQVIYINNQFPHLMHAVITFFTGCLWLPVWIILYLNHKK